MCCRTSPASPQPIPAFCRRASATLDGMPTRTAAKPLPDAHGKPARAGKQPDRATPGQVSYIMQLMYQTGYVLDIESERFGDLGTSFRQRTGHPKDWAASLTRQDASRLITTLQQERS